MDKNSAAGFICFIVRSRSHLDHAPMDFLYDQPPTTTYSLIDTSTFVLTASCSFSFNSESITNHTASDDGRERHQRPMLIHRIGWRGFGLALLVFLLLLGCSVAIGIYGPEVWYTESVSAWQCSPRPQITDPRVTYYSSAMCTGVRFEQGSTSSHTNTNHPQMPPHSLMNGSLMMHHRDRSNGSMRLCLEGEPWKGVISGLSRLHQRFQLIATPTNFHGSLSGKRAQLPFTVSIRAKHTPSPDEEWTTVIHNSTHSRTLECPIESTMCSDVVLVFEPYLMYTIYEIEVSIDPSTVPSDMVLYDVDFTVC